MAVTMQQVLAVLNVDEPAYPRASQLGPDALPHLEALIDGPDPMLASKAAYLAGLIPGDRSLPLVKRAATRPDPRIRIAAAATATNLAEAAADEVLLSLASDRDLGVRKTVVRSAPSKASPALRARIDEMSRQDPEQSIRQISSELLQRMQQP